MKYILYKTAGVVTKQWEWLQSSGSGYSGSGYKAVGVVTKKSGSGHKTAGVVTKPREWLQMTSHKMLIKIPLDCPVIMHINEHVNPNEITLLKNFLDLTQ